MPLRTNLARSPVTEIRVPLAGLRRSFCRPGAHRGVLFREEYCAQISIRPADSSGPQEYLDRRPPVRLRTHLIWESHDRAGRTVALRSTPRYRLLPGGIELL